MNHRDIDWEAIRERVAAAQAEKGPTPTLDEAEPETYDQLTHRIFNGGDLADRADRMFRH